MPSKGLPLFVFGTLMDAKVRRRILGRTLSRRFVSSAYIDGFVRVYIVRRPYPMLKVCPSGRVFGLLLYNLTGRDMSRLDDYEGDEYFQSRIAVWRHPGRKMIAVAYFCDAAVRPSCRHWQRKRERNVL
jgi:gamma-glutamylcyclotransferase (GGCT)/AIG2-like uncharacterized protein YtfP